MNFKELKNIIKKKNTYILKKTITVPKIDSLTFLLEKRVKTLK
jgi:hypothetical protein